MLNQLLKFTLVSSLLIWLRPRWKGLLALAAAVVLVHVLHGEYLEYVQLSGDDAHLVASFVVKWLLLLLAAATYLAYLLLGSRPDPAPGKRRAKAAPADTVPARPELADDGFDFLRHKKRLDSKAEKVIAAKPSSRD